MPDTPHLTLYFYIYIQENHLFCDVFGNLCFENIMGNFTLEQQCSCPMECDSLSYSFSVVSTPFNDIGLCPGTLKQPQPLMSEFYEKPFPKVFVRTLQRFIKNETDKPGEICKRNVKYRAEINFELATNNIAVTVTSKRLSFFDKLSGFGRFDYIDCDSKLFIFTCFRWNSWTFHRDEYFEYGGGGFLDCQSPYSDSETRFQ